MPNIPHGLLVAATKSAAGKTTTTIGLSLALMERGFVVSCAKAGPDFLDTGYHAGITQRPCANLDLWMQGADGVTRLWQRIGQTVPTADIILCEGAMGLFDGGEGSSCALAQALSLPILLLLDCRGVAESIAAMARGFLTHCKDLSFLGLCCTHVGSLRHAKLLKEALKGVCAETGVPLLGLLPRKGALQIPSRHLGLFCYSELEERMHFAELGSWIEQNCALTKMLALLGLPARKEPQERTVAFKKSFFFTAKMRKRKNTLRIAVAFDAAFCFCYAEVLSLWSRWGAEAVFFSPLKDAVLPECCAVYLPGGYPELHAQALAKNHALIANIREFARQGGAIYGECGGYIYLHKTLEVEGKSYGLLGVLPGVVRIASHPVALGYRSIRVRKEVLGKEQSILFRGHEFHYGYLEGGSASPWADAFDRDGEALGAVGERARHVFGSWIHLSCEGAQAFWRRWIAFLRLQRMKKSAYV